MIVFEIHLKLLAISVLRFSYLLKQVLGKDPFSLEPTKPQSDVLKINWVKAFILNNLLFCSS